jgi:hypothetical protein
VVQGHGRNLSWDVIQGAQSKILDEVSRALAEAVGDDPDADAAEGFTFSRDTGADDDDPRAGLAYVLSGVIMARPDASRIVARRFGGASLTQLAIHVAEAPFELDVTRVCRTYAEKVEHYRNKREAVLHTTQRDAAELLAVALAEIPALAHLARTPPDDPDAMEAATPGIGQAFPEATPGQIIRLSGFFQLWGALRTSYVRDMQARMRGESLSAAAIGMTLQAVHWRIDSIIRRIPEMSVALPIQGNKGIIGRTQSRLLGRQIESVVGDEAEEPDERTES